MATFQIENSNKLIKYYAEYVEWDLKMGSWEFVLFLLVEKGHSSDKVEFIW